MKRLSLQWRITLMSVLLIGITCVAMNLLLCSSGVYYMDTIADSLQGGGTVILNDSGAASFDPQLIAPNEELTIVVDGVQGRFRTTNWYITAAVTLIGGVLRFLAHFLIGVFVWGKWMPDTFLGKPMTSPWIYSLIYNGSYMLPSIVLCLVVFALLYKSLRKYFTSADLLAA